MLRKSDAGNTAGQNVKGGADLGRMVAVHVLLARLGRSSR